MVPGYNHNIRYKGVVIHIQTEDSGVGKPQITTLLYRDGTIIASKKTDYSDILRIEMLDKVVEDLMKEQHKEMLRRLKSGEFDGRVFTSQDTGAPPEETVSPGTASTVDAPPPPAPKPFIHPRPGQSLDEIIFEYLASDID
jgi:hypothetical protein